LIDLQTINANAGDEEARDQHNQKSTISHDVRSAPKPGFSFGKPGFIP
jgi:hypothetical protein